MNPSLLSTLRKTASTIGHKSTHRCKVGAVIFQKNRIISVGYNKAKTHPRLIHLFKYGSIHAEIDACWSAPSEESLKGSSIFVSRETADGAPALARPCPMCLQVLQEMGVKRAYWTTSEFPYWDTGLIEDMAKIIDRNIAYHTNYKKTNMVY